MPLKYRADIDGLRAFAVLAVILFHYFPEVLPGGYLGVDIFFVISGYLVTTILLNENNQNKFSFLGFYARRVRRLLPALTVVLFSTLLFGSVFMLSDEFKSLGLHTFFAGLFSSNFLLISETGYFDSFSSYKPLLHLWSLAVEEQFYLLWPLIIWLVFKIKKTMLRVTLFLLIFFSIVFHFFYVQIDQTFVFYSLATRFWELGLGGGVAYLKLQSDSAISINTQQTGNTSIRKYLPWMGISGILISLFNIPKLLNISILVIVIPVICSCVLIYVGPESYVNRILSKKIPVYIGRISYPAYLWHWPLLSFSFILTGSAGSLGFRIFLIITSIVLSILTFELLEKPMGKKSIGNLLTLKISGAFLLLVLSGLLIWKYQGFPGRYPAVESVLKSRESFRPQENVIENTKCQEQFYNTGGCAVLDLERNPTVVIIGDSHAAGVFSGVKKYYESKNENLLLLTKFATPPLLGTYVIKGEEKISLDGAIKYVLKKQSIHTVILSAFWAAYYEESLMRALSADHKYVIYNSSKPTEKDQAYIFETTLRHTLKKLLEAGKNVIFIYNVPLIQFNIKNCLMRPLLEHNFSCAISTEYATSIYSGYRKLVEKLKTEFSGHFNTYDPLLALCEQDNCQLIRNDKLIYNDSNHLTIDGANLLFKSYAE